MQAASLALRSAGRVPRRRRRQPPARLPPNAARARRAGGYANGFEQLCPGGDIANCIKVASWYVAGPGTNTTCDPDRCSSCAPTAERAEPIVPGPLNQTIKCVGGWLGGACSWAAARPAGRVAPALPLHAPFVCFLCLFSFSPRLTGVCASHLTPSLIAAPRSPRPAHTERASAAGMWTRRQLSPSSSAAPRPTSLLSASLRTPSLLSYRKTKPPSTFILASGLAQPACPSAWVVAIAPHGARTRTGAASAHCPPSSPHTLLASPARAAGKYVPLPEWDGQQLLACEWQVSGVSCAPA